MKKCKQCGTEKPLTEFDKRESDKYTAVCRECRRKRTRERYWLNRDKIRSQRTNAHAKFLYGLSPSDVDFMLYQQRDMCALCWQPIEGRKYVIDHDHKTGRVRGILHYRCNIMLGFIESNPNLVELVDLYLQRFNGPVATHYVRYKRPIQGEAH